MNLITGSEESLPSEYKTLAESGYMRPLRDAEMAIAFIRPVSVTWPMVREMCAEWGEFYEKNKLAYVLFNIHRENARGLREILRMIQNWKTALVFFRGELASAWEMRWVMCYLYSLDAIDKTAYCSELFTQEKPQLICPCRILSINLPELSRCIDASLRDQVVVLAQDQGVARCPNFSANRFRFLEGDTGQVFPMHFLRSATGYHPMKGRMRLLGFEIA